jgi:hypothetical protein
MEGKSTALDRVEAILDMNDAWTTGKGLPYAYVSNDAVRALVAHARALEAMVEAAELLTNTLDSDFNKAATAAQETRLALERACVKKDGG